jgi:hypothetical protein
MTEHFETRSKKGREGRIMSPAAYRACSTKRDRRSKADIDAIKKAIVDVIRADPPMTVRQVFYQLVARGVIEKTETQYQGTVIRLLTEMRLEGTLRWDWIVDESRRRRITQTYNNVVEALEDTAKFYRRSALKAAPDYLEIWCEKDALSALLWEITSKYDVPLMVSRGMPSLTFLYGTATWVRSAARWRKSTHIYQFGDWDPSGVLIPRSIEKRLAQMCEKLGCEPPSVTRVALTREHIAEYNLPTRPTKREGNRHAHGFEGESVELDALPPRILRQMARDVIERHITPRDLEITRAAEDSEREILEAFAIEAEDAQ